MMPENAGFVPWVTAWSAESHRTAQPCTHVGGKVAVFMPEAQGVGVPMFKEIHLPRRRRAFRERLCEVCGEYASPRDRWLWPMGNWLNDEGEIVDRTEARWFCAAQGFSHAKCGQNAKMHCPFLRSVVMQPRLAPQDTKIKGIERSDLPAGNSLSVIVSIHPGLSRAQYRNIFGNIEPIRGTHVGGRELDN